MNPIRSPLLFSMTLAAWCGIEGVNMHRGIGIEEMPRDTNYGGTLALDHTTTHFPHLSGPASNSLGLGHTLRSECSTFIA